MPGQLPTRAEIIEYLNAEINRLRGELANLPQQPEGPEDPRKTELERLIRQRERNLKAITAKSSAYILLSDTYLLDPMPGSLLK